MIKKSDYPELEALASMVQANGCDCVKDSTQTASYKWLTPVKFTIRNREFTFFIDDEYNDLSHSNPLLRVELMLRFLEHLGETDDYLSWCKELMLAPNTAGLLDYFKTAVNQYDQISEQINQHPIRAYISDLDFELNAGAAQYLRNLD